MIRFDLWPPARIIRAGIVRGGQEGRIPTIRRVIAAILIWLSAALPIAAQSAGEPERWAELADTIFRNYGPDDGLPISSVTSFAEDGDGFLWVGTQAGLARWDGYHFHVYKSDPADPGALQNDFIWCLKKDQQGRLWVGTNSGGVSRYDPVTDRFVTLSFGPSDLGNVPVRAFSEDGVGGMWVGSDRGLDHFSPDGQVLEHYQHDGDDPASLPGNRVLALLQDRTGALWVGTAGGLARQDQGTSGFISVSLDPAAAETPSIQALLETMDGRIWVAASNHGAYVQLSNGHFTKAFGDKGAPADLSGLTIRTLVETSPGVVWFGTEGSGIVAINTATGRMRRVRHDPARSSSLSHDYVFSLYRDQSGLIWAGTNSGFGGIDPSQRAVTTVFGGSHQTEGLAGVDVLSTLSARNGKIWVTYLTGGADILDPGGHRSATLRSDPANPKTALPSERVRAIAQSDSGDVYLGTYHGLYRAEEEGTNLRQIPVSPELSNPAIFSLLNDGAGLWVGTRGEGLWHIDYGSGASRRFAAKDLTGQWISAIAPSADGRLWVGSYQGLYLLDPVSEQVQQVLPAPQDTQSLSVGLISSLHTDRRGRLWVASGGGGIAVVDGYDTHGRPRFRRIGLFEGLPGLNAATVLEDKSGAIWAGIEMGSIVRIDPDALATLVLQRAEGIGLRGFAMNAGAVTPEGEMLFGGDGGLIVVRPDDVKPWAWRPPIVATDVRIGGRQFPPQAVDGAGEKTALVIIPGANSLSVEFAALDYSAPERNRYEYRLEGYDNGWVATDATRRLASYTNLPPGTYTLHLRGSNRDGVWTTKSLDIPIKVIPAWYQTIWFRLALAVAAIIGVWLLVRFRTSYLRHRQVVLEQQVAQRTAELRQSNSQLEARTAELGQSLQEVAESRAKVANLLDTSGQGFLSFGADLIVEPDYSRACALMLDGPPRGRRADELLFPEDAGKAELFHEVVSKALTSEDPFKRDLLLSLLPVSTERLNRLLKLEYRRLDNGHLMVVMTDVTEERRLSRRIDSERRRLAMIVAAVTESRDFFDAVESFRQFFRQDLMHILAAQAEPLSIHQEISRQIHTFKGMLTQFNFESAPRMLDDLEERLSELQRNGEAMTAGKIVELVLSADFHGTLETDLTVLRNAFGEDFLDQGKRVFLTMSQAKRLRAVAEQLLAGESLDLRSSELRQLFEEFRNLDKIELGEALAVYEHTIGQVAKRLDKEMKRLSIDSDQEVWLDSEHYGPFLRSLVHVFRNAVVHGIEDPEARLASGKDPAGRIDCIIRREGSSFTLAIIDDGAGIDAVELRDRAVDLGLMSKDHATGLSDDDVFALIFADRLSVHKQADELAGRGVGLAAVRAETQALGGEVTVASSLGTGTRFLFALPLPANADTWQTADMTGG